MRKKTVGKFFERRADTIGDTFSVPETSATDAERPSTPHLETRKTMPDQFAGLSTIAHTESAVIAESMAALHGYG